MNRWHVFEYLRNVTLRTGRIPGEEELAIEFGGRITVDELSQGIHEFSRYMDIRRKQVN